MKSFGWLVVALVLASTAGKGVETPDPFYLRLLEEGRRLLEQGQAEESARILRLACFGLLEAPDRLAACWLELGSARAALKDREGLLEVLRKLEEIEERFRVLSAGGVPVARQTELLDQMVNLLGFEALIRSTHFGYWALERARVELQAVASERQERELSRRLDSDPENPVWKILAAEREVSSGKAAEADRWLASMPASWAGGYVACLRAGSAALQGRCQPPELDLCPRKMRTVALWSAEIRCWLATGRREEARACWQQVPSELKAQEGWGELRDQMEGLDPRTREEPGSVWIAEFRRRVTAAQTAQELSQLGEELEGSERPELSERDLALLRGEVAYRAARWGECTRWYRTVGLETIREPALRFYAAVCLYESGEREEARKMVSEGLEGLARTPFIESYLKKIGAR